MIVSAKEKKRGLPSNPKPFIIFVEWIFKESIFDVKFLSNKFTCIKGRIYEILESVLLNIIWKTQMHTTIVHHLSRATTD